jgi:hypothetical protein
MRKLVIIAAVVVALIGGLVVAYNLAYPTYSHRYRLTIEVDTPEGLKIGSGVIEPAAQMQPPLLTDRSYHTELRGDALFVDLGQGKNVVALLSRGRNALDVDAPVRLAIEAFGFGTCTAPMCGWRKMETLKGTRELRPELVPTLITFADPSNAKTARVIDPANSRPPLGTGTVSSVLMWSA